MKILRESSPAHIPNQEGFRFIGIFNDGSERECKVAKKEDGTHFVEGIKFGSLRAWKDIPEESL